MPTAQATDKPKKETPSKDSPGKAPQTAAVPTKDPQKKPETAAASKPEPGEVKLTNMMYLGPSLADGSLRRGQTFIRGIPERFENEAQIKQLFVPASELPRIKKQLRDPKSWISRRIANFVDPTMGGNK